MYRRALDADPNHADNLGSYALFLHDDRKDLDAADAVYRRALHADSTHANNLGYYATFLRLERKDLDAADVMYRRALHANHAHAHNLGNYGRLHLETDRVVQGLELVDRAIQLLSADLPCVLDPECWMYVYCCGAPDRRVAALTRLRRLVEAHGVETGDWDFSKIIRQARRMEHPEATWLPALAEVLAGREPVTALAAWDAWQGVDASLPPAGASAPEMP